MNDINLKIFLILSKSVYLAFTFHEMVTFDSMISVTV